MLSKGSHPHVKQLRDLDLNSIDKPKTLVIMHYNSTRISVPLFQEVLDLPDLLYHHISTLEQQILNSKPDWEKKTHQQIVCFQIKKEAKKKEGEERISDGDLRSDILLSLLRLKGEQQIEDLAFRIDVTKVYKYLEVEPFYRQPQRQEVERSAFLHFYRIIQNAPNANCYLARRVGDGCFLSARVFAQASKVGLSEARVLEHMSYIDQQGSPTRSSLLLRSQSLVCIPHPESESSEEEETPESCQHVAVLHPYLVRGSLEELLQETRFGRKRISQMDCLNYLKELMWGMHLLHEKYNLLHRALSPSSILVDQNGQLRLGRFAYCVPCFDSQGQFAQYCPKTRYPKDGFSLQELLQEEGLDVEEYSAPELLHGPNYNYLADFYSVGKIVRKLYEQSQLLQRGPVNPNNQSLMMAMIDKLTSPNLSERAGIIHQILQDIAREDLEQQPQNNPHPLTLQDIKVGRNIEATEDKKFIENEELSNGIRHQTIFDFFKQPAKRTVKKIRKGSRDKVMGKGSREKSQKCLSKVSDNSQQKKRKLSSNSKNKSFNNSSQDLIKNSRQKPASTSIKNVHKESPAHRKTGKSKSQERKKDPLTCTKLYTYHQEEQKKPVIVVPKSPKAAPLRIKSPGMRQK